MLEFSALRAALLASPPLLQAVLAGIAILAVLSLVGWWSSARGRRRARVRVESLSADLTLAQRDLALAQERIAARDSRQAELASEAAELRSRLDASEHARGEAQGLAERRAEAITRLDHQMTRDRDDRTEARRTQEALAAKHAALQAEHSALKADRDEKLASAQRELAALKDLREEMAREFQEIAGATLRRTGADLEKSHLDRLTGLLTPFKEHVGRFEEELRNVHKSADSERTRLGEQIRMLTQKTDAIGVEAVNLTRALKGDKQKQGAWGEMILERLLEESGLIEGTHYDRQKSHTDAEGGRFRPDVIVRMPQGKALVVDSKVSLIAYEAASGAEDDAARTSHLRAHVAALKRHVDTLSAKGYAALADGAVDYVLMFIPIEGALSEAWRVEDGLSSYAAARKVGLVTPTTLMLALKTVDHIWTVEKRERNAEAIADRAGKLYDKFAGFVGDVEKIGRALDQATRAKDDAMSKLTTGAGNLVGQAEKLRRLGARTDKRLELQHETEDEDGDDDVDVDAPPAPRLVATHPGK